MNPLKKLAKSRKMTLKELAILVGLSPQRVYHICENRVQPSSDDVARLSNTFGIDILDLSYQFEEHYEVLKEELRTRLMGVSDER